MGFFAAKTADEFFISHEAAALLGEILVAFIAYFVNIIIHECGHLVMGLLTGYRFVSFRIGSFMIIRENNKLVRKKFSIPGTGGQCLMTHDPVSSPNEIHYFWYHFGGGLFNLLTAAVSLILYLNTDQPIVELAAMNFLFLSLFSGLINLIPLDMGILNDGMNILRQYKDPAVRMVMLNVLIINGMLYDSVRLIDIPAELFEGEDLNGSFPFSDLALTKTGIYIYNHDFEEAERRLTALSENDKMAAILVNEAKCELLFCKIMLKRPKDEIDGLYGKELKAYIKQTEKYVIARSRLMYAYYLLYEKNNDKAEHTFHEAEKMHDSHPCEIEYICETELMNYIKNVNC